MHSIEASNLAVAYDDHLIVPNLDLCLPQGKITSIIGPNGCGKSTVLKAVGRLLKPRGGMVYLNGRDIRQMSTREIAKKMAVLPQTPQAPGGLTVNELVSFGRFPHQKGFGRLSEEDKKTVRWALEATRLTGYETTPVDNLSGGQRQRVWIAMALAQQTDLILLDEPTTYLDLSYQLEVLELLQRLNSEQGCTIVMVLHDLNLAARFSHYMVAVRNGEMVYSGTPEEVMQHEVLKKTFSIDAEIVMDPRTGKPACITYNLINEA